jgi:hypothetical protein
MPTSLTLDAKCAEHAYSRLLLSHIDELRDSRDSEGDLKAAVDALLAGFDVVSRVDSVNSAIAGACLADSTQPWPLPGDTLWLPVGQTLCESAENRVPVVVQLTFKGKDGDTLCIVERQCSEGRHSYRVVGVMTLAPDKCAPTFFESALRTDKVFATKFLQKVGILDRSGRLSKDYGGED